VKALMNTCVNKVRAGHAIAFAAMLVMAAQPANAEDARADFMTQMFVNACLPHLGDSAGVRAWAEGQHLPQIESPSALDIFVGPGGQGAAWAVHNTTGNFALSIRGKTHGCTVWAQSVEPEQVEADFKSMLAAVQAAAPGADLRTDKDTTDQSKAGAVHSLAYNLQSSSPGASRSFEFMMQTAEHENAAFQASIEVAPASAR
jgi:hypothetical protein